MSDLAARTVVFVYPSMGIDESALEEWTAIPGARGCTPEACGFRDQLGAFRSAKVEVLGLSGQPAGQERDAVKRLGLPYPSRRSPGSPITRRDKAAREQGKRASSSMRPVARRGGCLGGDTAASHHRLDRLLT